MGKLFWSSCVLHRVIFARDLIGLRKLGCEVIVLWVVGFSWGYLAGWDWVH